MGNESSRNSHAMNISDDGVKVAMFLKLTFLKVNQGENFLKNIHQKHCMYRQTDCNVLRMAILKNTKALMQWLMGGMFGKKVSRAVLELNGFRKLKEKAI